MEILHDEMRRLSSNMQKNDNNGSFASAGGDRIPGIIWTAGDSSLDNKYWFSDTRSAVPGAYSKMLRPKRSKCDVTYWLNYELQNRGGSSNRNEDFIGVINTAVEATTLNQRAGGMNLTEQDIFLRDHLRSDDVLIVSVGGNDVALCPTPCTIASILGLLCIPQSFIENGCTFYSCPLDDYCCGCSSSLLSCACSFPPCMGYVNHLFGKRVEHYIRALTSKTKPKKILVCMIYFPDESRSPSWAGAALSALNYNSNPDKLQSIIKRVFEEATSQIKVPGVDEIIPVPLFNVLNGKNPDDYVARVEPSSLGGRKMASYLLDAIFEGNLWLPNPSSGTTSPLMMNRS